MEGDFVARSSITKMIESTIGGNGNRVNGVIITNLEAISSRPDQSEDAPSFPPLDPSRAFDASNRIFHRLVFKSRNSSSSTMETPTDHAAFLHFLSTASTSFIYIYIYIQSYHSSRIHFPGEYRGDCPMQLDMSSL